MKLLFKPNLWPAMAFFTLFIATSCETRRNESNDGNMLRNDSAVITDTLISDVKSIEVALDTLKSLNMKTEDTLDIETCLKLGNDIINDMKKIHIKNASDTLKFNYLKRKWGYLDKYTTSFNVDEMKHSDKIRVLKQSLSVLEEMERLSEDLDAAGVEGGLSEKEKRSTQEYKNNLKRKIWLETH